MKEKQQTNQPLSREKIYRITVMLTYLVSGAFIIKNLVGGDIPGTIIDSAVLAVFSIALLIMRLLNVKKDTKRLIVSSSIIVLVFIIGLTTGSYYSEDFCLYLAVIGLTGLYLKPAYAWVQIVLADIFLIIQYAVHPEKADPISQYIMCMISFTVAGVMFAMVITRGRAFIKRTEQRTRDAEALLDSMRTIGQELETNFHAASKRMDSLKAANETMHDSADILQHSSESISSDAYEVSTSCDHVQVSMQETNQHIQTLNENIHSFEEILGINQRNMAEMNEQMNTVKRTSDETSRVFRLLDEEMHQIASVTAEINKIASNTGLLAVNASIEAARAGAAGKGFAVVATNVRELAVDSTRSSDEIAGVVSSMQTQIDNTSRQIEDSATAIAASLQTLTSFQDSFREMMEQFTAIYSNIAAQTASINQVSGIFDTLKDHATTMSANSEENQNSVASIANTMRIYRDNIAAVIEDNLRTQELSQNMLDVASSTNYGSVE